MLIHILKLADMFEGSECTSDRICRCWKSS